jgi:multidrug resistance efflux pump
MKYLNEIALLIVIVCVIALPLVEMLKKKVKANKENAKIESEKKLKVDEFDRNLIRLEKLGKLHKDGVISKEEFERKKKDFQL